MSFEVIVNNEKPLFNLETLLKRHPLFLFTINFFAMYIENILKLSNLDYRVSYK